jgi:hypothetical protein
MAKIRARYAVKGPKKEKVTYTKCSMNPETKSLEQQSVTEEMDCYWVMFPQGHSIRVTSFEKLKELGFHVKPRMVDMDTGDLIDVGGDPYDFGNNIQDNGDVVLMDDEDEPIVVNSKSGKNKE